MLSEGAAYTVAVSKGSALLNEMKALLRAWSPTESLKDFQERVVQEDVLGKTTAQRANDVVRRVFANRFLLSEPSPARHLHRLLESRHTNRLVSDLCLLYSARQDVLLRDVIVNVYWPAVSEGRLALGLKDIQAFFSHAHERGRIPQPWSEQVRIKVARGLLRALCDFGFLREVKGRRETVSYRPVDQTIVYLVHELHFRGITDVAMVEHADWGLFGLKKHEVITELDRLSGEGWWLCQAAGDVVRISWKHKSMDEVIDALLG